MAGICGVDAAGHAVGEDFATEVLTKFRHESVETRVRFLASAHAAMIVEGWQFRNVCCRRQPGDWVVGGLRRFGSSLPGGEIRCNLFVEGGCKFIKVQVVVWEVILDFGSLRFGR